LRKRLELGGSGRESTSFWPGGAFFSAADGPVLWFSFGLECDHAHEGGACNRPPVASILQPLADPRPPLRSAS